MSAPEWRWQQKGNSTRCYRRHPEPVTRLPGKYKYIVRILRSSNFQHMRPVLYSGKKKETFCPETGKIIFSYWCGANHFLHQCIMAEVLHNVLRFQKVLNFYHFREILFLALYMHSNLDPAILVIYLHVLLSGTPPVSQQWRTLQYVYRYAPSKSAVTHIAICLQVRPQ